MSMQLLCFAPLKVTPKATIKEPDDYSPNLGGLDANHAVYHLPSSLSAYGAFDAHDFGNALGLLKYVAAFVNRPRPKITADQIRAGVQIPRGQKKLEQLLRVAVHGPDSPDDPNLANPSDEFLRHHTAGIHWMHQLELVPGGAEWKHHAHILDADAFYNLIATLLMSEVNRDAVAQCQYSECGKFFIVERPVKGRPQSVYHDEACRRNANDAGATTRQRDRRTRLAAIEILRGLGFASSDKRTAAVKRAQLEHPNSTADQLASHARVLLKSARKSK
jgi:hypothetical protein